MRGDADVSCAGPALRAVCWALGIDNDWWMLVVVYAISVFKNKRQAEQKEKGWGLQAQEWRVQLQGLALQSALFHQGSWAEFPQTKGRTEKRKILQICLKHKNYFVLLIFCILAISNNLHNCVPCCHDDSSPGNYQYYVTCFTHVFHSLACSCKCHRTASFCHLQAGLTHWNMPMSHTDKNKVYASICGYFFFRCFTWHLHRSKPCWTHCKCRVMSLHIIYFGNIQEFKEV